MVAGLSTSEFIDDRVSLLIAEGVAVDFPLAQLIERGLSDVDMAFLNGGAHESPEEREHQRANVGAVDVGVRHDDEFVVAQFFGVKGPFIVLVVAYACTESPDHGLNLLVLEHLGHVVHLPLHVQNFSTKWKDGLRAAISASLC